MKLKSLIMIAVLGLASQAQAGPYADELKKCLVESSSPKDLTLLVRWIAKAINAHPHLSDISSLSERKKAEIDQQLARYFERVLFQDCSAPARDLIKYENADGMRVAFEFLGQIAMKQVMEDPKVTQSVSDFSKYFNPLR